MAGADNIIHTKNQCLCVKYVQWNQTVDSKLSNKQDYLKLEYSIL